MPLILTWPEVGVRLALTLLTGILVGINRSEHGRPVGVRTTSLVCLAAAIAMIEANLLLATRSRPADSFVTMDVMRLPLGILSGMGFIGGGAILRRGEMVHGLTTAATLWLVTVIGLCFGAGAIALGLTAFVLTILILWVLSWLETSFRPQHRATLEVTTKLQFTHELALRAKIADAGLKTLSSSVFYQQQENRAHTTYEVEWRPRKHEVHPPSVLQQLVEDENILELKWSARDN